MHLIRNAVEAFIGINATSETFCDRGWSPHVSISTEVVENNRVAIWIVDNGPGIAPEIQDRIFDPFFTTKDVGAGTGLGLFISYQIIIKQHVGRLECYSVPQQGTKFLIELPICISMLERSKVTGQLAS